MNFKSIMNNNNNNNNNNYNNNNNNNNKIFERKASLSQKQIFI